MKRNKPGPQEPTLCWKCKNTNRFKCPWFNPDDPQPVPGWVAEPRTTYHGTESYLVRECPNFVPENPPTGTRHATAKTRGTKIPGVNWRRRDGRWYAGIKWNGQHYYLGSYLEREDALAARRAAEEAIERGEEPRRINRRKKA